MIEKIKNEGFISKQESLLLAEKVKLEEELKSVVKFPEYGDSEEDNTQEVMQFEDNKGMETRIRKILLETNSALDKIAQGQYDKCSTCGQKIDTARLEAFPAALTCVQCSRK